MSERRVIKEFVIDTKVYDTKLAEKVFDELSQDLPEMDKEFYYGIELVFDRHVYNQAEFYKYPLEKEPVEWKNGKEKKSEKELLKDMLYAILSEQIHKVSKNLKDLDIDIESAAIIGDDIDENQIKTTFYQGKRKEYQKNGKLKAQLSGYSIMPDRPHLIEHAIKFFADYCMEKMREEQKKEFEKSQHTPNMIKAGIVFTALQEALNTNKNSKDWISEAKIESDWPLKIKKKSKTEKQIDIIDEDTEIDCPEFLLYKEEIDGFWILEKIENLASAKHIITKEGLNLKRTKDIVVLHNLSPVRFSLFEDTTEGLVAIDTENARGKKNLHLSWNK